MLLSAQWRGGSTFAEGLIFTTSDEARSLFLLDEPAITAYALARPHGDVFPDVPRPQVAAFNAEALSCHFHHYNQSKLHSWQADRAELSGLSALSFTSFAALRRACLRRDRHSRALKTIRMIGSLPSFMAHPLARSTWCRVMLLVRHPLAIIRSRRKIIGPSTLARADLDPAYVCRLMLQDVRAVIDMTTVAASEQAESHGRRHSSQLLRYSDLVRNPHRAAREVHSHLQLHTNSTALDAFISKHMGGAEDGQTTYSLDRARRECASTTRMDSVHSCASLLILTHPLYDC